jgi:uncharacterized membrane protein YdbT with pleckstrin-like domain
LIYKSTAKQSNNHAQNEKIINIYRQTEAVLFKPVLIVFVLIYFPWYFLLKFDLAANYIRLLFFWTILVFLYAARKFFLWLVNIYLLNNQRLVHINYEGVFNKRVVETPLNKIASVGFSSKGFWQALFNYGSVEVQITALGQSIILKNISQPSQVKDLLWKAHNNNVK